MSDHAHSIHSGRALLVICTAAFLAPFMGSALNLALPEISASLSLDAVELTWLTIAYLIPTAIFQVPAARMGDLLGRKRVFVWGVLGFSLFTFASGFAPSGTVLIALRFLAGMCCAMMFGNNIAILTSVFPPHERGKVLGINTAMVYSSLAAGPFVGGLLTHYFGWQSIFFVSGAVSFAVHIFARVYLKGEWTVAKGERFDYAGSVLYGIGIMGLICGFTRLSSIDGFVWLSIGGAALFAFVYYERRCDAPLINLKLFSENRVFAFSSLATLINYAATSAIAFMLSLYLQYIKGMDARHAGLILISQACVMAVFALVSGRLSDRFSASRLATFGMAVIVAGLVIMLFLSPTTPIGVIIGSLFLLGLGFGLFSSPNTNVIMGSVDKKHYGQASATTGTMRLTGQAFSMGIAGMVIALKIGNRQITPEIFPQFMQSLRITFIIFVVLCVIGIYASSVRTKK
ncbi:MFS transporter [Ereboglobus sp. PH5-10]|uniref:MFS transporter n=1 Tax=Ereboglobus sp. PH5-10 TaxID=2940629 RepID=UPI0024055183|nr:MFS transporter [Ereboglobus sp. PH5-10]